MDGSQILLAVLIVISGAVALYQAFLKWKDGDYTGAKVNFIIIGLMVIFIAIVHLWVGR